MQFVLCPLCSALLLCVKGVLSLPIYENDINNLNDESFLPQKRSPEENIGVHIKDGWLREGDILMESMTRQAVRNHQTTWTTRHIPYVIDSNFETKESDFIKNAIKQFHDIVGTDCITFREKQDGDIDYVNIRQNGGCHSVVGRKGGMQNISLAPECLYQEKLQGTVFHELMHTLGFWHEHTRPDRDQFIKVLWDNIDYNDQDNFVKMSEKDVQVMYDYDYYSVMHYSMYAFQNSENVTTLQPLDKTLDTSMIGQRVNLTTHDRLKIRQLYKCDLKACESPGTLKNGVMIVKDKTVGSKIVYKCNDDYILIGPDERICTDNATWTGEVPVCMNPRKGIYHYCSFEKTDICGWESEWTWTSYPTPTHNTGPTWDHTWQSSGGSYLYADGDTLSQNGELVLMSPTLINNNVDYCISFTTSMIGIGMGALNVTCAVCDTVEPLTIWSGNQNGEEWNRRVLEVTFPDNCKPVNFKLVFTAVKGTTIESDIAIDDVLIASCETVQLFIKEQESNAVSTTTHQNIDTYSQQIGR